MLKMLTAHTLEIDDEQEALHEILAQLNLAGSTCKHSIAMLSCHPDCVETGVAQYISAKLPFDTVGFTTISSRTSGAQEVPMLSIAVLTSDTVRFTSAWVPGLTKGATPAIKSAMQSAIAAGPGGSPSLIFPFFPFAQGISVEALMDTVMETARNVPMFGTISIDNTKDYSNCYTLYNGVASKTGFAAILFFGDITPRFFVAAVPSENLHSAHAIVTKSHQNILQEVNGKPFVEYLNSVGITDESGMMSVPFMVDSHDGAGMVARAIYAITPEGYAACAGNIAEGSFLTLSTVDRNALLRASSQALQEAHQVPNRNAIFGLSCIARYYVLASMEKMQEEKLLEEISQNDTPFLLSYSGGEVCPVAAPDGSYVNRLHNFSFAMCVL